MLRSRVVAAPVLAVWALATTAAPATAEEAWQEPEIAWVNQNVVTTSHGERARLLVKYRCWGEGLHLWGSAKQGPELDPAKGRTSSHYSVSWRETPEGPTPTCNGKWQVERVFLEDTPDTAGHAPLARGPAWVQLVIFTTSPTFDPTTFEGVARAAAQGWKNVRGSA